MNKIYSLSKHLISLHPSLKDTIKIIETDNILRAIDLEENSSLIFEERHIPNVLNIVKAHQNLKTRFICIGKNLNSEDRLILLNNNIECISPEKFMQISTVFFNVASNKSEYKVLIVEDDENQILLTEHILKNANIDVISITKGKDVFSALENFCPDLVLLDLYLEDMTGDEIVRNIREKHQYTLLPVVFLTSDTSVETRMKVLNAGADDLLTKPINSDLLVSALKNRMLRSSKSRLNFSDSLHLNNDSSSSINSNTNNKSQLQHDVANIESENLSSFLSVNSKNKDAAILWIKIKGKKLLQNKVGYLGFKSLCESILRKLPLFNFDFDSKIKLAEGVYVLASKKLAVNQIKKMIDQSNDWLENNSFSYQDENHYIKIISIVLNDIPIKKEINLLIKKAENTLIDNTSDKDFIILDGEDDKEITYEVIKQQLENTIKTRNFSWRYTKILSNRNSVLKIIQPHIVVFSKNNKELLPQDYLDVAQKSGMSRLLNRFIFEHAIRIIKANEKKDTIVLINQSLADFHSKELRHRFIDAVKDLKFVKKSIYFQFSIDDAKKHLEDLTDIGLDLKRANINICLSDFDTRKSSWAIARALKVSWIAVNKFIEKDDDFDSGSMSDLANIVNKANILCYKTLATKVDTPELAKKLKDLNIDMIQGGFIKPLGFND